MAYYKVAYSTPETISNTMFFTHDVLTWRVPGVLVECGVAAGAQLAAMQDVLLQRREPRWIYGFDSFEGIPLASEEDDQQPGIPGPKPVFGYRKKRELLRSSGVTVHSLESVQSNLEEWFPAKHDNIRLVKGWFQDTLEAYRPIIRSYKGIALLRLDGDLYESTRVSLETLFPLLNTGGVLIIDDWMLAGCRRACEEYFANVRVSRIEPPEFTEGPAYFRKED